MIVIHLFGATRSDRWYLQGGATGIDRNSTMPRLKQCDLSGFTVRIGEGRRTSGDRRAIFTGMDAGSA